MADNSLDRSLDEILAERKPVRNTHITLSASVNWLGLWMLCKWTLTCSLSYRMPAAAQAPVVEAAETMAAATASDATEMITRAMASERYAAY